MNRRDFRLWRNARLTILLIFLAGPGRVFALPLGEEVFLTPVETRLENGIRVVIAEDHSVPLVAFQTWIRAGSINETDATSGIAHLLEHMLFRKMVPPGSEREKLAERIEDAGGEVNAYTSPDRTVVHMVLPSGEWEQGVSGIGEALRSSNFNPGDLREEKRVVLEEIRRGEDLPQSRLMRELFAEAYWVHPYGRRVLGTPENVRGFTVDDIKEFFETFYRPERIVIVVAGDVSVRQVVQRLEKEFSRYSPFPRPGACRTDEKCRFLREGQCPPEPRQRGTRRDVERGRWSRARLALAYHSVDVNDPQVPAVDLLSSLLAGGTSSLLKRGLEEKKRLVHLVDAYSYTPQDPGLFLITAVLDPENVLPTLREILGQMERIGRGEVQPGDLERAKAQIVSGYYREGESREGRAGQLGFLYSMSGGIEYERKYLERIRSMTAGEVAAAAGRFLNPDNLTVKMLLPERPLPGFDEADIDVVVSDFLPDRESRERPGSSGARILQRGPAGTKVLFPNGLTLLFRERERAGTVAMVAVVRGGLLAEETGEGGLSNFMAQLIPRGTERLGALGVAEAVEGIGGSFEGFSGFQSTGVQAELLSSEWEEGLALLAEMIVGPSFPEAELGKLKEKIAAEIKARDENLTRFALLEFRKELYGRHPYGRDVLGTTDSLRRISRKGIQEHYRRLVRPDRMVLSVVGGIEEGRVIARVGELFGGWNPKPGKASGVFAAEGAGESGSCDPVKRPGRPGPREKKIPVPGSLQAHIVFGYPGTCIDSPERYPLELLDAILSGQSGRLFRSLRDERGLAYMVGSINQLGIDPGFFAVYLATAPERLPEAVRAVEDELKSLREGIADSEMERAKASVVGDYRIRLGTSAGIASELAFSELYGIGYDFLTRYPEKVKKVKKENIYKAIIDFLDTMKKSMVIIGAIDG